MAGLPIVIEIDPTGAQTGATAIERSLTRLEDAGKKAGQRIQRSLQDSFRGIDLDTLTQGLAKGTGGTGGAAKVFDAFDSALVDMIRTSREAEPVFQVMRKTNGQWSDSFGELKAKGESATSMLSELGVVAKGIGIGVLAKGAIDLADGFTNLQNRLRTTIGTTTDMEAASDALFDIAQETGSAWASTSEIYVRTAGAAKELGLSQNDLLGFTETLTKAVKLSGASSIEADNAMRQLSQGIASGTLRGDELRSVLEQLPTVADVIAEHFGVTRGELRKMGEDGKIGAKDVIEAFREAGPEIEAQFGDRIPTISEQFTKLTNTVQRAIGDLMPLLQPAIDKLIQLGDAYGAVVGKAGDALGGAIDFFTAPLRELKEAIDPSTMSAEEAEAMFQQWSITLAAMNLPVKSLADSLREQMTIQERLNSEIVMGTGRFFDYTDAIGGLSVALRELAQDTKTAAELIEDTMAIAAGGLGVAAAITVKEGLKDAKEINRELERSARDAARALKEQAEAFRELQEAEEDRRRNAVLTPRFFGALPVVDGAREGVAGLGLGGLRESLEDDGSAFDAFFADQAAKAEALRQSRQTAFQIMADEMRLATEEANRLKIEVIDLEAAFIGVAENAAGSLANALVDAAISGKLAWDEWARSVLDNMARIAAQAALLTGLQSILGGAKKGPSVPVFGGDGSLPFGTTLFGGMFANGGSFTVPGSGGTDSTLLMARVTPGEHVSIQTPQQRAAGAGGPGAQVHNQINNIVDPESFVSLIDTPAGARAVLNVIRLHAQSVKGVLR